MNTEEEWADQQGLTIVSENHIFCDCDEGCKGCNEEEWDKEDD